MTSIPYLFIQPPVNHFSPSNYSTRFPSKHTQIDDFSKPVGSRKSKFMLGM